VRLRRGTFPALLAHENDYHKRAKGSLVLIARKADAKLRPPFKESGPDCAWGNETVRVRFLSLTGTNVMFGHKIPMGETDSFEPVPLSGPFLVQCDECGEEHSYEPEEVLRLEFELPESFTRIRDSARHSFRLPLVEDLQ